MGNYCAKICAGHCPLAHSPKPIEKCRSNFKAFFGATDLLINKSEWRNVANTNLPHSYCGCGGKNCDDDQATQQPNMADNGLIIPAATCHMPTTNCNLCLTAENECALHWHSQALTAAPASASLLPISFADFNLNFCLANQCVSIWCSSPYFVSLRCCRHPFSEKCNLICIALPRQVASANAL